MTPIELSSELISLLLLGSGLMLLPVVLRSKLRRDDADEGKGGRVGDGIPEPEVLNTPRAKLTVFTWLSSVLAFDSIRAAASELEKRGGSDGRG